MRNFCIVTEHMHLTTVKRMESRKCCQMMLSVNNGLKVIAIYMNESYRYHVIDCLKMINPRACVVSIICIPFHPYQRKLLGSRCCYYYLILQQQLSLPLLQQLLKTCYYANNFNGEKVRKEGKRRKKKADYMDQEMSHTENLTGINMGEPDQSFKYTYVSYINNMSLV
uniref:Uncharacterized protein n=1 Tax=Onchocerca volvulus TaxID=6282 RepID=A0A8R1TVV8_ONCVO